HGLGRIHDKIEEYFPELYWVCGNLRKIRSQICLQGDFPRTQLAAREIEDIVYNFVGVDRHATVAILFEHHAYTCDDFVGAVSILSDACQRRARLLEIRLLSFEPTCSGV